MRIALAQTNPTVGDVAGNVEAILEAWDAAAEGGADLVVLPELAIVGYPPGDLILDPAFLDALDEARDELVGRGPDGTTAIIGTVTRTDATGDRADWDVSVPARDDLRNSAVVLRDGEEIGRYHKARLPAYGVFDEARWFIPGRDPLVIEIDGTAVGVTICEDLWADPGPISAAAGAGADLVVSLNASPYHRGKRDQRERWVHHQATSHDIALAYVNLVGGQDGVVFDGDSLVCRRDGEVVARGEQFATDLVLCDLDGEPEDAPRLDPTAEVWEALVLGTRDYCTKNGFERVTLGLSGGIDSTLVAVLAADALGGENVLGVLMPSPYTADRSNEDAEALAENLGMPTLTLPIEGLMEGFDAVLATTFEGRGRDETEENIQARIRGTLLMALSNKLGHLVLATGNKSEASVGYATLYGDMVGGLAPILDCYKQLVYALADHRNERGAVIPQAIIDRPPTAELAPGQSDEDALPPYAELDEILRRYIDEVEGADEIISAGHHETTVREVLRMVDRAEFKRKQAAPAIKISESAFDKDRRMPITNAWRH